MVQALDPNRVIEADELLVVSAGDQKTRIYKGALMRVQKKLAELEFYKGSIDGTYSDKTRFAITEFQQSRGLNITGIPDQVTLLNLLRGKES
jgi:peptidoglycan hydrolase-like protein with peptidoglycan-binding domain